jgi:hypothetical protein
MLMTHRLTVIIPFIVGLLLSGSALEAQTVSVAEQRSASVVYDRWNLRFFRPAFTTGLQVGLLPTFLKDEVHAELPPVAARVGYQFLPAFSLEVEAGRSVSRTLVLDHNTRTEKPGRNTFSLVALRPTGYLRLGERADAYGGLLLGYQHNRIESLQPLDKGEEPRFFPRNGFIMTGFIGVDYAITPRLRANAELALGLSLVSTGVRYRWR